MKDSTSDQTLTKVEEVRKKIREMAIEKGPDAQLLPVRELCELFSTSRITLREALAPLLADRTLYSKEREGIFVSPHIHHKLVAILFDASVFALRGVSPFWTNLWFLFSQEAERRARFKQQTYEFYTIMPNMDASHSLPDQVIQMITNQKVDGVLAVGLSSPLREWLLKQSIAYVSFAGGGPWVVELDSVEMVTMAARALLQQGCTKIGLWQIALQRQEQDDIQDYATFQGLQRAYQEALLPFNSQYSKILPLPVVQPTYSMPFQEQGYLLAKEYFSLPESERPDGVILGDEMLAHGALTALQELGVRIGQDVKIASHANMNSPMLFGYRNMTIFEFDAIEIVQTMFSLLDTLLQGQTPHAPVTSILPRKVQR
ncbi:hypothetical protein KDA_71580 [Dictyobacter alpinus]|uniref:HTH gntR-type domain-containing protein n=1 Tax=Dictyobacter alpinus TaxID=2014873 RepID=A0A402BK09_9CHLR|nr:substrate-binding domain-containing protein [Dictyobacter alpinus]GCE31674.1 hypothetical protein KDA_71580 [Dictyobacter alpinus]